MLTLYFDFTSLASAVAVRRVERLTQAGGSPDAVRFVGFDLLGSDQTLPVTIDVLEEIDRWQQAALDEGLVVRRPRLRPPTIAAHLVSDLADSIGAGAAWRTGVFDSYFAADQDLADVEVLLAVGRTIGLAPDAIRDVVTDTAARAAARRRMAHLRQRGLAGVPVLDADGALVSPHVDDAALASLLRLHGGAPVA
ncbi:MAG: DsbA family protein [Nitriliruptoraceae bacterium]